MIYTWLGDIQLDKAAWIVWIISEMPSRQLKLSQNNGIVTRVRYVVAYHRYYSTSSGVYF